MFTAPNSRHRSVAFGECERDCPADARAAAGDESDLAFKVHEITFVYDRLVACLHLALFAQEANPDFEDRDLSVERFGLRDFARLVVCLDTLLQLLDNLQILAQ